MDPLILATTAIATTLATKFGEKTGEQLSETVFEKTGQFLANLKRKAPKTASALEKTPQEPLDYGQAILEVHEVAQTDPDLATALKTLAAAAQQDPNPTLQQLLQDLNTSLKNQPPTVENIGKLAEKIGLVVQGGSVSIQTLNVD